MRESLLRLLARFACRHYAAVLGVAALATAASFWSLTRLEFTSEISDLLPPDSPAVARFLKVNEKYGSTDFLVVVVEKDAEGGADVVVEDMMDFADAFADALAARPDVQYVDYRLDEAVLDFYRSTFLDFALLYLDADGLEAFREKLSGEAIRRQTALHREALRTAAAPGVRRLVLADPFALRDVFAPQLASARGGLRIALEQGYYFSEDRAMLLMLVKPRVSAQDTRFSQAFMRGVRETERRVRAEAPEWAPLRVGYTGTYAIAEDYVAAITKDAAWTFVFSFVSVMGLFLVAFRRGGMLVIAGLPLLMGIAWTLGLVSLYFGRINVVTSTMGAILIGLGIDYGVHIYNQYAHERALGRTTDKSIETALVGIGNGLLSSALTTALAFYALAPTGFRGLSELGLATGTGILLCLLAMFMGMPALLTLRSRFFRDTPDRYRMKGFGLERAEAALLRRPRLVAWILAALTAALGAAAFGITFDDDFRNIRPDEGAAIELQKRLVERVGSPLLYTLVTVEGDSRAEALARARRLEESLGELKRAGHVVSWNSVLAFLPPESRQAAALAWLARVRETEPEALSAARVRRDFEAALKAEGFESVAPFEEALDGVARALAVRRAITLDDLELHEIGTLVRRFYAPPSGAERAHEFAFYVYLSEAGERRGEAVQALLAAVDALPGAEAMSAKVLGVELKRIVREDFGRASVLAFLAVVGVLAFHFRSPLRMAIAVVPLLVAVVWMVGLMSLFRVPFNLVNAAVLPIILGIGIDNGIHMLHHYLTDGGRDLGHTFRLVGRAVAMTSLTTMAGFGSLIFSAYGGLHTVGQAALLGIASCFAAALTVQPLLIHFARGRLGDSRKKSHALPRVQSAENLDSEGS